MRLLQACGDRDTRTCSTVATNNSVHLPQCAALIRSRLSLSTYRPTADRGCGANNRALNMFLCVRKFSSIVGGSPPLWLSVAKRSGESVDRWLIEWYAFSFTNKAANVCGCDSHVLFTAAAQTLESRSYSQQMGELIIV